MQHVCGQCNQEFGTEEEYLTHVCEKTGVAPTEPQAMGPGYENIQAKALERGAAKVAE